MLKIHAKLDKKSLAHVEKLGEAAKNMRASLAQFTRAVADSVHDDLADTNGDVDYSKLKVVHFGKVGKFEVTALVLPSSLRALTKEDEWRTAVNAIPSDAKNTDQLAVKSGGPWLAEMLPAWVKDSMRLVSRRISTEEADALLEKIVDDPNKVDLLVYWGMVKRGTASDIVTQVRLLAFPEGLEVQEDVAWRVLRQEFGIGGEQSTPRWRTALKGTHDVGQELLTNFWKNLLGDDLKPTDEDKALAGKMRPVEAFQAFVSGDKAMT